MEVLEGDFLIMKIAVSLLVVLVLVLGCAAWTFIVLLRSGSSEVSEEEGAAIREGLVDELGVEPGSDAAIAMVTGVTTVRIVPLPRLLPRFDLSPHRIACVVGLVGIMLTLGAAAWCTFIPKVTFVGSVSTEDVPADERSGPD